VRSDLAALAAVLLWGSLASLAISLDTVPPLLMTGIGLVVGSTIALPISGFKIRRLIPKKRVLLVDVYGLLGYHFALFAGLQNAPSVQANLVNYLWPILVVLLAPLFIKGTKLTYMHWIAGILGFSGAALAILSGTELVGGFAVGYLYAGIAALIFSSYSLISKGLADSPTAAVGGYSCVAGVLAIISHFTFEPAATIEPIQWLWLVLMGLGPLGGSFYLWDCALKHAPAQRVGTIAFFTPLISTVLLLTVTDQRMTPTLGLSAALILLAAIFGSRVNNKHHDIWRV
jgi:drug/metabolite transporter (DMT)-like permease